MLASLLWSGRIFKRALLRQNTLPYRCHLVSYSDIETGLRKKEKRITGLCTHSLEMLCHYECISEEVKTEAVKQRIHEWRLSFHNTTVSVYT